ncbi:hypothetical protein A9Q77_10170 [Marinomonas sp. 42_23_T18]|nr:hypothetical protein A9Q77_10170 [Marinomonas sp. 42_23_T18]
MFSCTVDIEIAANLDEVWLQLVNIEFYGLWSPSIVHVELPASSTTLLSSPVKFTLNTLSGRQIRKGKISELSAPHSLDFHFSRAYNWWLEERWLMRMSVNEKGNALVEIHLEYLGWMKTSAFHHEHLLTKALLEAHLIALKEKLETLAYDEDGDDEIFDGFN